MAKGRKTGGRTKGTPNVVSRDVKEMLREALDLAGGVDYLLAQSDKNPNAFMALIGKAFITEKTSAEQSGTLTIKWESDDGGNHNTLRAKVAPTGSAPKR